MSSPDIFRYLKYRDFLRDALGALQAASPRISLRALSKKSGFTSPNFLQLVIKGDRNLNSATLAALAKVFKMNQRETGFFRDLVGYDQSKRPEEKDYFYRKILGTAKYAVTRILDKSQYDFFSHWYIPVVRELLAHRDFDGSSAWIADRVFPRITVAKVNSAISLLESLGLARPDKVTGKWELSDAMIRTESETDHLGIRNYHVAAIDLARESLRMFGPGERDVRSVTLGLSNDGYGEIKSKLEAVWKELLEIASTQRVTDGVFQVNMQLFPLTRAPHARKAGSAA